MTPNPRETTTNPLFLIALDRAPPAASSCVCGYRWGWRTGRHVSTGLVEPFGGLVGATRTIGGCDEATDTLYVDCVSTPSAITHHIVYSC